MSELHQLYEKKAVVTVSVHCVEWFLQKWSLMVGDWYQLFRHALWYSAWSKLWPWKGLIQTHISALNLKTCTEKVTNCCFSAFQRQQQQQQPYFVQRGNIVQAVWWSSGWPTLSCFGPVYQPQCVPPTSISSSSPLHTTSGTETSPNTSPTHILLVIWAILYIQTSCLIIISIFESPLPLGLSVCCSRANGCLTL